jgi:hypothetical protein
MACTKVEAALADAFYFAIEPLDLRHNGSDERASDR